MVDEIRQAKLRPVYAAIDAGNYQSAIKICGRKDIQSWDLTKSLLAYCYAKVPSLLNFLLFHDSYFR